MSVPLLAALHANQDDQQPIVTVGDHQLHPAELLGAAAAVANRIGNARGVAIDATPDIRTVIAVVGCLVAGVPAIPVPPDSGSAELGHILADSGAQIWAGAPRPGVSLPILEVDPAELSSTTRAEFDPESAALIIYTSGTTGAPKGVVLSRRAIAAGIDGVAAAWEWNADDVLVHGLPLCHVHGLVLGVLGALRIGSPLIHTVRPKAELYAAAGGTLYFGVPTVWSRVCADPASARALAGARLLVSGSAPLPMPVFEALTALTNTAPIERYGMTETIITLSTRYADERWPGWVGLPISGVRTRIRSESGELAAHDGESLGQLEVTGPTLFDGYLNNPDKTAETMTPDGWFRTGDIAVINPGGSHRIVGRESVDMIKSGGYRIGAGEVEHALLTHPGIHEAAVIGVPDADLGQRIVGYVVGDAASPQAVIDHVASSLSVHKRPREIRFVNALPRNAMGKVQKKALLADNE